MASKHRSLLKMYLQLPGRLEAAIAALNDEQLDLKLGTGWSIREYVQHTVEKETRLTVRDIVLIHLGQIDQHTADIHAIRNALKA